MVAITLTPKIKEIDKLLEHCKTHNYPNKSIILDGNSRSESLFYILTGSVAISIKSDDDKELVVAYLNQGNFFGEIGLFAGSSERRDHNISVQARTACKIAEINYDKFRELAKANPDMLYSVSHQLASALRNTTLKVGNLAFLDVTGRVARTLLELCKHPDAMTHPDGMQIKITRQEISRIVGCSREMAGRVLKVLEEQGLIHVRGKTIVVFGTR